MRDCHQSVQDILSQPLAYLHLQRLSIGPALDTPALRAVINDLLATQRDSLVASQPLSAITRLWLEHWSLLPEVASLIGAYLAWPHLAKGGRMLHLSASQRTFASHVLAPRLADLHLDTSPLPEQLQALGLNALQGGGAQVPKALHERLQLQFSSSVLAQQPDLPTASSDAALLILAIQHARFYPDID